MQRMTGRLSLVTGSGYGEGVFANDPTLLTAQIQAGYVPNNIPAIKFDNAMQVRTASETRSTNTAFHPRIHA
ncbi:hypothetical protein [Bordetella pseudohinzii]|nr:hypothetical protein [Bordetella pseudohinzii]